MTRRDYVLIAAALKEARRQIQAKEPAEHQRDLNDGVSYAADYLSEALARDNPRFDAKRFALATF